MNKKYYWIIVFVILIIIGGIFIINSSQISQDNTLIIGYNESAPYFYVDSSGNFTGFDFEVAQEVAKRNNWTLKIVPIDWNLKQNYLDNGTIDCIWGAFTVNNRGGNYTFSNPYLDSKQVVVVLKDSNINNLNDLNGKIVEVQSGTSVVDACDNQNKTTASSFARLVEVDGFDTIFKDLNNGSCDAAIIDVGVANYYINGSDKYIILNESFNSEKYSIGFKLGNTALKDQIEHTLDEMFKDGTIHKIAKKYNIEDSLIK